MNEQRCSNGDPTASSTPEPRYSYYRRCQVFRKGGEQCKAPAEKVSHICYAHAGQLATAVRRERERRAVLTEAVAEMRQRGKPECEMADLFMDFKGIQVTLAVMAQALIDGRIDCKTAGRLVVHLQTMSKLLWMVHRKGISTTEASSPGRRSQTNMRTYLRPRDGSGAGPSGPIWLLKKAQPNLRTSRDDDPQIGAFSKEARRHREGAKSPQICAERRLSTGRLSNKREQPGLRVAQTALTSAIARDIHGEDSRVAIDAKVRTFPERRGCRDGPWQWAKAA